nr:transketolase C-terminal domain-containing protein [Pseudonocardia sp. ICBG1293]
MTSTSATTTLAQELNSALQDEMSADNSVVVLGEDVGVLGGVFRVTDGLSKKFGEARCFDTPVSEAGIMGMAIGMAIYGLRPVIEMQFDAFAYPAFEQIVSHVAKMRHRSRGRLDLPMVIRIPFGGGVGAVEQHSDSSESYYSHTPGLRVVAPSCAEDAYGLLRSSIQCSDPVVFLEPKRLYYVRSDKSDRANEIPLGAGAVKRAGRDVTLVSYGPSVSTCLAAANVAAEGGLEVGVVDLRSLVPIDDEVLFSEIRRSGKVVVVAESHGYASVASEISARISERCFEYLRGRFRSRRVGPVWIGAGS